MYAFAIVRVCIYHTLQTGFEKPLLRRAVGDQRKYDSSAQHEALFQELEVSCRCRW